MRGKINKRVVARAFATMVLGAAGLILPAAMCGANTNYLDGVRDFPDLVQRVEKESRNGIRRNKDGAVEYIAVDAANDDSLVLICCEPSVRELRCIYPRCTDRGMSALEQMTNLTSLVIVRTNTLPTVSKLTQLHKLDLMCTTMKPADLPCLIKLTNLEDLDTWYAWEMGTNSISAMTNFPHLKRLIIRGGGDRRDEIIANCRTNGYESGTNWDAWRNPGPGEFTAWTNLTSLEELHIRAFADFGDEQLRLLGCLPKLKSLELMRTRVSKNWSNIVSHFPALTNAVAWLPDDTDESTFKPHKWVRNSAGRQAETNSK